MHSLIIAALLGAQPNVSDTSVTRVQVETLTRAGLERHDGKTLVVTVPVTKPANTCGTGQNVRTFFGSNCGDGAELSVSLKGNRLRDTDLGTKVSVVGTLRLIRHPATTINGREFFGFAEFRLEERDMTPALALAVQLTTATRRGGDTAVALKFDTISLKDAERLDGAAVVIRFTVATSAVTQGTGANLCTVVGPEDRGDGAEWSVFLRGHRLNDADDGAKLTVTGRLRVIKHPAAVVGGVQVEAWTEVRVTEG